MRKLICLFLFFVTLSLSFTAYAILSMELTRGVSGAIPIAVVPFQAANGAPSQDVASIIARDLQNSGRFKVFGKNDLSQFPSEPTKVSNDYFRKLGTDNIVIGKVQALGGDRYEVNFQLLALGGVGTGGNIDVNQKFTVSADELRSVAHHISDLVYEKITGTRGIFSTKLAYVVVQHTPVAKYILEVADQDGFNPRPLLTSPEPVMSPAWSPDGRQIAYVSFEKKRAGVYIEDVTTGSRRLLSQFPGINGAPSWSPDGKKLAIVLSKSGSPNIYLMDVATGALRQMTNDYYINTEPAFSPDGRTLLFTSNRSGGPQIYQINVATGANSRVSYDGDYNARASYSHDGKTIAMIHRVSGIFNIALLDLDTGTLRVVSSQSGDSTSPSIAPNGSMILYDTYTGERNVLGMVSSDGHVQLRLPARNGEAQDPAWSPFLS